jgi:Xaa-Pro aminopeptidase
MSPAPRDPGVLVGMMGLEDGARVDFGALRAERRATVLAGMERHGIDAMVLGGAGNVHYVSGARHLGRAGAFGFAPACVVVRATGKVHLLSTWDEGVPPEIGRDEMYGIFWNPANLLAALAAIPSLAEAQTVGTDGLTPLFAQLLPTLFPTAEMVDAGSVLDEARRRKTPGELVCLDVASAIAEAALTALDEAIEPGVTERELLAVFDECVARLGATTPPTESVAFATPNRGPVRFRHLASDRPIGDGELVILSPTALYAGYESGLARTRLVGRTAPRGTAELGDRCTAGLDALVAACRPGNTGADLYRAWENTGNCEPPVALAHGAGLGAEPPVIGFGLGAGETIDEGMVLTVQSWVAAEGIGGCLERTTVRIAETSAIPLTRYGRLL